MSARTITMAMPKSIAQRAQRGVLPTSRLKVVFIPALHHQKLFKSRVHARDLYETRLLPQSVCPLVCKKPEDVLTIIHRGRSRERREYCFEVFGASGTDF